MWLGMGLNDGGIYDHRVIENELMMSDYTSMLNELNSIPPPQMLPPHPQPPPPPPFMQHDRAQHEQVGRVHLPHPRYNTLSSTRGRRAETNRTAGQSRGRGNKDAQLKSTVNPSKRHRDRLNLELDNLSKLLPFSEDVIARLDKLSILRLSVSYLRNKNFYRGQRAVPSNKETGKKLTSQASSTSSSEQTSTNNQDGQFRKLLNKAIDGFIIVVTVDGELFYVSESVKEYLGYSQSQVLHQPFETLLHDDDKEEVASILKSPPTTQVMEVTDNEIQEFPEYDTNEKDFVVRLKSALNTNTSDLYKPFRICGSIRRLHMEPDISNLKYALFAICTPARTNCSMLEVRIKTTLFCSKNRIDLSFLDLDARGKEFFGYSKKDIFGRSSYVLVHRQDLQHLRCKHSEIMTCGKTSIGTFRLMSKNDDWAWVCGYARVYYKNGKPDFLVTTNRIMSEEEGQAMLKIRDKADYKSLEKIGLIEPDDPVKALELGFPNRAAAINNSLDILKDKPIPMPLQAFIPPEIPPGYCDEAMDSPKLDTDLLFGCDSESQIVDDKFPSSNVQCDAKPNETLQLPSCPLPPPEVMVQSPSNASHVSEHTVKSRTSRHSTGSVSGHSQHSVNSGGVLYDQPQNIDNWSSFHASPHSTSSSKGSLGHQNMNGLRKSSISSTSNTSHQSNNQFNTSINNSQSNVHNFFPDQNRHENYANQNENYASHNEFSSGFQNNSHISNQRASPQDDFMSISNYPSVQNLKNDDFDFMTSTDHMVGPNVTLNSPQYPNLMNALQQQMGLQEQIRLPGSNITQRNFAPYPPFVEGGGWIQSPTQNQAIFPSSMASNNIPVENPNTAQEMLDFLHNHQHLQYTWQ